MAVTNEKLLFDNKVVIVTGGSNGIGAATVSLFIEQGARVASFDVREQTGPAHDSRIDIRVNVASDAEVKTAVQKVIHKWGTVDVLCNVAGITDISARVAETTDEDLMNIMGINFFGLFYMMRAVIPHFLAKPKPETLTLGGAFSVPLPLSTRGSIVNVCSVAAVRGGANGAPYTSAKHALMGLTRNTAVGYAVDGIKCNAVLPGPVNTQIVSHSNGEVLHPDGGPVFQAAGKPLLGLAQPIDIARAILFLAGAESANGAELAIDGAYLVR